MDSASVRDQLMTVRGRIYECENVLKTSFPASSRAKKCTGCTKGELFRTNVNKH